MSEIFELMHQANQVAETAKDAIAHSLAADKTTEGLAREILSEAKRLLPGHRLVQSLAFAEGDVSWVSVRSAMQAVSEALSAKNAEGLRAANSRVIRRGGTWS